MKKIKKSVKAILISVVAVVCVLAIVLGCVFGLKKDTTQSNNIYALTADQVDLGNKINEQKADSKLLYEFDENLLFNADGIQNVSRDRVIRFYD